MARYNKGNKVKTVDFWNDGLGTVIPKGSIVTVMYDNGNMCRCDYNGKSVWYEYQWLGEVVGRESNPQTNADRIRAMSDEELAEWIVNHDDVTERDGRLGKEGVMKWLKSSIEKEQET